VLADTLVEERLPGHELETEPLLDHGKAYADEAGDAGGRATLANRSDPDFDLLPESDLADMDDFVARLQILLPVLGADFVRPTPKIYFLTLPPTGGKEAMDRA
jgi:hypothetical protein